MIYVLNTTEECKNLENLWTELLFVLIYTFSMFCVSEQVEKIKNVMKNIKLPKMNIPSWARLVPEEEWKAQLVEKAVHKDSQSPGNLSSQTKDSQCSSKGKDDPSTSK